MPEHTLQLHKPPDIIQSSLYYKRLVKSTFPGNFVRPPGLRVQLPPVLPRRAAQNLPEGLREVAHVVEAAALADLRDSELRRLQQVARLDDAVLLAVLDGRGPDHIVEAAQALARADHRTAGDVLRGQRLGKVLPNVAEHQLDALVLPHGAPGVVRRLLRQMTGQQIEEVRQLYSLSIPHFVHPKLREEVHPP